MKLNQNTIVRGFFNKVKDADHFKTNGVIDTNKFCAKLIAEYPQCNYTTVERYLRDNKALQEKRLQALIDNPVDNVLHPMGITG